MILPRAVDLRLEPVDELGHASSLKRLARCPVHPVHPQTDDLLHAQSPAQPPGLRSGGRARTCNNRLQRPSRAIHRVCCNALTCIYVRASVPLVANTR
jgi:hypothetical protein